MRTFADEKKNFPISDKKQIRKFNDSKPLSDSELDDLLTDVEEAVTQTEKEEHSMT